MKMTKCNKPFAPRVLAIAGLMLFAAAVVRADNLAIENVTITPRDAKTAIVKFDITWTNAWCWGNFHDAAWVFFKVKQAGTWQHARLVADPPSPGSSGAASKVLNPSGFSTGEGTPLKVIVPSDRLGAFVRMAKDGNGLVAARGVTLLCESVSPNSMVRGCAIEMVYVAGGAFSLGSGGSELNRFYQWTDGNQETKPYRVTGLGAIPTGRQKDKLWSSGLTPEDGGAIPESFPNGFAAFYAMKPSHITLGQYATFLGTIAETDADKRHYPGFFGGLIVRTGASPDRVYSTPAPHAPCPWLSWLDGAAFAAWAGLRPMTELEYEKAVHGQDIPTPNEAKPSYWGLAVVNQDAMERMVSAGSIEGRKFTGTHGQGAVTLPTDWPKELGDILFRGRLPSRSYQEVSDLLTSGRINALDVQMVRAPRLGWRAARTAPAESGDPVAGHFDTGSAQRVVLMEKPPSLDSAPDGWGKPLAVMNTPADVFPVYFRFVPYDYYGIKPPWQGPKDLSATVYLAADKEALYIAVTVNDDRHINNQSYDGIPAGDAIQIGLVNPQGTHWNMALALTTNGVSFHQFAGAGNTLLETADCIVKRVDPTGDGAGAGGITRYGFRLPLASLGLKTGDEFAFNMLVLDSDDGKAARYWLRPAAGIEYPWRTELYPRFALTGK